MRNFGFILLHVGLDFDFLMVQELSYISVLLNAKFMVLLLRVQISLTHWIIPVSFEENLLIVYIALSFENLQIYCWI